MHSNFNFSTSHGLHVPYQTQISPSLTNGTQIHISGTPTGNRFEVNLKNNHDDVVLHFNPRFDDRALVLNSAQRGAWGTEERRGLPFTRGVRFTLVIMATDHGFNISVNNSHLCEFHLRTPMHLAQLLEIKGDITLESAQVFPGGMAGPTSFPHMGGPISSPHMGVPTGFPNMGGPTTFPHMGGPTTFPHMGGHMPSVHSTHAPFSGSGFNPGFGFPSAPPPVVPVSSFPMGGSGVPSIQSCKIYVGSRIFVRGFISPGANRFELNLLQGYSDSDDIAFHFNPRFDSHTIVKNHRRNGQWGHEENQSFPPYMPLIQGAQIDLQIACQPDKYTVYMNNQLIAEYHHKITPGAVMALQYKGDITVTSVGQL